MTLEQIVLLITGILGSGGLITALVAWRKDARQGPVDRQAAQVADAVAVSQAATSWVQYQDGKMREQDAKIAEQDTRISTLMGRIDALTVNYTEVRERLDDWSNWYDDVREKWPYHRLQETAPRPPYWG